MKQYKYRVQNTLTEKFVHSWQTLTTAYNSVFCFVTKSKAHWNLALNTNSTNTEIAIAMALIVQLRQLRSNNDYRRRFYYVLCVCGIILLNEQVCLWVREKYGER